MMDRCALLILSVVVLFSATTTRFTVAAPTSESELPKRIVVANSSSWIPYSFLDDAGKPRGVLIELWRLFAQKNDVEVEFKLVDWADSIEMVRKGQAQVHGGLISTEERRETLHFFPKEILRIRTLVFFDEDVGVRDLASMSDMPMGAIAGSAEEDFMRKRFSNIPLKLFPNGQSLIKSAIDGEISAFISDYPTGYYHLIMQHSLDRFETGPTLFTEPVKIATRLGDEGELDRIAASVVDIPRAEIVRALNKWLIPEPELPPWVWPTVIAGVLALVLAGIGMHLLAVRRTLRVKTQELRASLAKLSAANQELDRLARMDGLTEVTNRFAFLEMAPREMERAKRYERALSLVMIDLDHFKAINDQYGHQTGDAVLKQIANTVRTHLRPSDVFARLGGEEFAMLLPETDSQLAAHLVERILDSVVTTAVVHDDKRISVSFSAGIAEYRANDTLDTLIANADAALFQSKALGRAQVTLAAASG
jgi:diguanylate cyclase (GGDEF)-like protein